MGKKNKKEVVAKANNLLDKVDIKSELRGKFPTNLSGGEAARVGIARALVSEPIVVFADEPTGALNRMASAEVMEELVRLNQEGTTIMMVTHDVKVAAKCKRVLYIVDGTIKGEYLAPEEKGLQELDKERRLNTWLMDLGW